MAHLAPGRPANLRGAPRPTPGGLVRGPARHAAKCRSRVGRGGSWKQRHLSQNGNRIRERRRL
eukprot:269364-Pyramimonas_sp.AAC.1